MERTTTPGEPPTYDVIDGMGRLVEQVKLAMRARVAGFGAGAVYVVRRDSDDLEYLERLLSPHAEVGRSDATDQGT